ncbi:MAG: DUF3667 domain-containing protein [Flavobacteriales bacterium]|nr:DUF3667 domain-containing protein [Flavobacteriales bacterium]
MSKGRSLIPQERKLQQCLNCSTPLQGESFCHECGQENSDKNITLGTLVKDFLGDYFSFDSKFFNTFIPLLIHPGKVPAEFMDGKRVSHVPPLRSLIFTSFIFFLIWGWTFTPEIRQPKEIVEDFDEQIQLDLEEAKAKGDSMVVVGNDNANITFTNVDSLQSDGLMSQIETLKVLLDEGEDLTTAVDSVSNGKKGFERRFYTQVGKMYLSDTASTVKYFVSNFSLMILLVQPVLALLLKLLYIRKKTRFRFIEHIVFSLYYHAWLLIMATIGTLLALGLESLEPEAFAGILGMIYLPMAIKRFYRQSWMKSLGKSFILFLLYLGVIMPLFMVISLALSFYFF